MATSRFSMRVLATLTLWAGFGLSASGQIPTLTVDKALEAKPRQPGVAVTTPAPADAARHRIDPIPNPKQPGSNMGYVVRDPAGKPVRQFVSYDGKTFNIVAFYADGQEAYREIFPPSANEPHQFRWLGPNGGKWGLDKDRDGTVDEWVVISPEEASQELLQAVLTRDPKRLAALLPTKENLDALGLPADRAADLQRRAAEAGKRLAAAADSLKLSPQAKWVHLELGIPQTTPADAFGGREDLVAHRNGTILIQDGNDTKFLQTGEMVLVGRSWKLIDGPAAGPGGLDAHAAAPGAPVVTQEITELVKRLDELDNREAPRDPTPEALAAYYGKRADLLEQIVQKLPPKDQEVWVRLLIDSLAAAADSGKPDGKHHRRLKELKDALAKAPQNPLAAYSAFRLITAENGMAMAQATGDALKAAQDKYRAALEEFVQTHQAAEDAPEAVMRLAIAYEGAGREGEAKAKHWYDFLAKTYAQNPAAAAHVAKANGALKRLDSEGKPFDLSGPNIATGQPVSIGQLNGKVVVVFYWATWSSSLAEDVKKLKDLAATYGTKGLTIVTVCLDDDPKVAAQAVPGLQLPGAHLHLPGGVDRSPLAAAYGIQVVPHLFVIGKDGKVANRNAQITTLEDDVKKLVQ
jgi:hypothetical protein